MGEGGDLKLRGGANLCLGPKPGWHYGGNEKYSAKESKFLSSLFATKLYTGCPTKKGYSNK